MGLDQYALARRGEPKSVETQSIFGEPMTVLEYPESNELAYWRKHPNLQGWMENLYREKGGEETFNCEEVELTSEDLDALEAAVRGESLPSTQGFFFGQDADDYYTEADLEFIRQAREAIADGFTVVYYSWW